MGEGGGTEKGGGERGRVQNDTRDCESAVIKDKGFGHSGHRAGIVPRCLHGHWHLDLLTPPTGPCPTCEL